LVAVVILGAVYTIVEWTEFEKRTKNYRAEFINENKERVKVETMKVVNYINLTRFSLEEDMQASIRNQVEQAWLVMENIYNENKASKTKVEIKKLIKDALRPIRFYNGRGYYFIVSMDGTEELFPVEPQYEGANLMDLQDLNGNYVIRDEIRVVTENREGFVTDYWTKPGGENEMIYPKTSYVKLFEPLNWYVGCGEYLDNFEKDLKEKVKLNIKNIRFGKYGYVFIDSYSGHAVVIDSPIFKEGDYVGDLMDPNGVKVLEEQLKLAKEQGGGFVEYMWEKPGTTINLPKISYVFGYDNWEWVIGAGTYIDEIENVISEQRNQLYNNLQKRLLISLIVMIIIVMIIWGLTKRISGKIKHNFETFIFKLQSAVETGVALNSKDYSLQDISITVGSINAILEKKIKIEKSLEESESRFRTIVENIPVMILVLDQGAVFRTGNNEATKFFKIMPGFQVDVPYLESLLTDSPLNVSAKTIYTSFDGQFRELEVKSLIGVRTQNWAAFTTETDEIIMVGYDITEMKLYQQELKQLNETKDKFFSIISHDLRSPFNAIIGFSDLLMEDYKDYSDKERLEFISIINSSAFATLKLLNNLLSWARAQSGKIQVNLEKLELDRVVDEVINVLNPVANSKSVILNSDINKHQLVYADHDMTNTVLYNLISNSIKFTGEGGQITVGASFEEEFLNVSVRDTGIGIPDEIIPKLFNVAGNDSRKGTKNESGTGLGLVICKEFVEKMGGKIWLESKEDVGTTFFFSLKTNH
jgi:signal transduction histidine kinase